ncbi:MAG: two-component system, response regulator PdtaR [Methanofollis sp.]|nr:two-component system, response regulator PdtaR [Methanofollis sp.]
MVSSDKPGILIVEDDVILSTLTKTMLVRMGYDVTGTVSTVQEALSSVVEHAPDLVLMDINLGTKFDGIDAANYIYHCFNTPVVFLTGTADWEVLKRAKTAEPFGYVTKPFTKEGLCAAIEVAYNSFQINKPEIDRIRKKILETMAGDDAYLIIDEKGTIIFMNGYAEHMTGFSYGEAFLNALGNVLLMKDRQSEVRFSKQSLIKDLGTASILNQVYVVRVVSRNRKVKNAKLSTKTINDRSGKLMGYIVKLEEVQGKML